MVAETMLLAQGCKNNKLPAATMPHRNVEGRGTSIFLVFWLLVIPLSWALLSVQNSGCIASVTASSVNNGLNNEWKRNPTQ